MPSSAIEGVQYIIEFIRRNKPDLRTVLDIGIGFGKFGYLLRDYFDAKEKHYFQPSEWKLKITGVDVFQGYLSDIQYKIYNKIIIGDIITVLPKLGHFDLAILSDVIEHFSKKNGQILLDTIFKHVEDVVIATPLGFLPKTSRSIQINPAEEHKSGWTLGDFRKYSIIDKAIVSRIRKPQKVLVVYIKKHV